MKKIILILLLTYGLEQKACQGHCGDSFTIQNCIDQAEAQKRNCVRKCIEKYKMNDCSCDHDYVINDCLENDPNIEIIKSCIDDCDRQRSYAFQCCIYNPLLDPAYSYLN